MCKYKSIESLLEEIIASDVNVQHFMLMLYETRYATRFNDVRIFLWRRLELSRVSSVPRAIVYQPCIRQQVDFFCVLLLIHGNVQRLRVVLYRRDKQN